jgi:hypothetical protein
MQVAGLQLAAVSSGVELKAMAPHLVRVDGTEPPGVLGAGPTTLLGPDRTTQSFLAPEPLDACMWFTHVHRLAELSLDPPMGGR